MHRSFLSAASALIVSLAAFALMAAGAQAATVTAITSPDGGFEELRFQAGPGEENDVSVSVKGAFFASGWLVNDNTWPLTAGPGCTSLDAHTASCPFTSTELNIAVRVDLGDGRDWASVAQACGRNDMDFPCHGATVDGGSGIDLIWGGEDTPSVLRGGADEDHLLAGRVGATLDGGPGSDWLIGSAARDRLIAGAGDDIHVFGYAGNDSVSGGDGADLVDGGKGNDTISGGRGRDRMIGGSGRDKFSAKDGFRDRIDGGSSRDSATVDRGRDTTKSVERVR